MAPGAIGLRFEAPGIGRVDANPPGSAGFLLQHMRCLVREHGELSTRRQVREAGGQLDLLAKREGKCADAGGAALSRTRRPERHVPNRR